MKLRKLLSKEVDYFGITLRVASDLMCIATDSDGTIYGYYEKPVIPSEKSICWTCWGEAVSLATVELDGTDWRETLRYV